MRTIGKLALLFVAMSVFLVSQEAKAGILYTDITAFQAATSSLTVINFDVDDDGANIAHFTQLTNEYDDFGVQFNPFNSGELRVYSGLNATSTPNVLLGSQLTAGSGGFESVFATPSTAFGLQFGGLQSDRIHTQLDLFDENDGLIASYDVQNEIGEDEFNFRFLGVISTTPIAKVQVSVGANDFVWFDDLMVGSASASTSAVPEPSSFLLFSATGVIFLLARNRRGRRQQS